MAERGRSVEGNRAAQPVTGSVGLNMPTFPIVEGVISPQQYMAANQKRVIGLLIINYLKQRHKKNSREQLIELLNYISPPGAVPKVIQQYDQIPYN